MIQDISPHRYDNQYRPVPPDRESIALYYEEQKCLLKKTPEGIIFPRFKDLERLNEEIYEDYIYLFTIDEERYYLVSEINRERSSPYMLESTEIFRQGEPQYRAVAGITGYQPVSYTHLDVYKRQVCGRAGICQESHVRGRI